MDEVIAERLAANETRFREINQRLGEDLTDLVEGDERIPFVCECSDTGCREAVELSLAEYRRVRADDQHFAVRPGHERPEIEHVIGRGEGFLVVEKHRAEGVTEIER